MLMRGRPCTDRFPTACLLESGKVSFPWAVFCRESLSSSIALMRAGTRSGKRCECLRTWGWLSDSAVEALWCYRPRRRLPMSKWCARLPNCSVIPTVANSGSSRTIASRRINRWRVSWVARLETNGCRYQDCARWARKGCPFAGLTSMSSPNMARLPSAWAAARGLCTR